MKNEIIFHIVEGNSWEEQMDADNYIHQSLAHEGFIHCCYKTQIAGVLSRYFEGIENLILLEIDPERIAHKILVEKAPNGMYFPHIYGSINKTAVLQTTKIR